MSGPGHDVSEARSALGLRAVLAGFGLVFGIVGATVAVAWFPDRDEGPAFAIVLGICLVMVVTAAIDLVVIARRRRERRGGN
jgi:Na+/melibiose symporter-like transporter